ncbi:manganese efflux pump MntP family protein [Curtobacterium sp. MCPF17_050]|uniref:manganese efflux pump MntP n=1 Tax=Curtobacterium sp. MCPF17_050 TaxID=2175664 RepID=UPI000D906C12|nr:manganese efflux pump MntP family protein [Curtobacterium sp. MCPF17_050]WIB14853.1 manganese efflux pump MntP family protein [Curtobacterium sp. MCPF17_050]
MSFWALFLIALGVSADAFAVALGKGLHMKRFSVRQAVVIALVFGASQALMPLLGWLLGTAFASAIADVDHWVAFGLLALVGGKMLWEAFHGHEDTDEDTDRLRVRELLVLAVATSIDALAVGITLAFLPVSIGWAVLLIGVTTAVLSYVGVVVGRRVGARFGKPAEIAGGVVLILIGVQIVLEHTGVLG